MVDACDTDRSDGAAFQATHQDPAQSIAKCCGLATLQGTDQEHAGLGAVLGYLVLDAVDLVLQHSLGRGKEREPEKAGGSDATALGPTATVVGQGSDIPDQGDLKAGNLKGADRGFSAGTGTSNQDLDLTHALFKSAASGSFGSGLSRKRSSFSSSFKSTCTG